VLCPAVTRSQAALLLLDATVSLGSLLNASDGRLREGVMRGHLRKRGDSWELRAYAGVDPVTDRQKYVTRTFRGAKRDAEEALARLVIEVAGGGMSAQDTTVGDLLRQWFALAESDLSPSTARGYEWIATKYILPALAKVPLSKLKTAQLDRYYSNLRERGGKDGGPLSAATVRQVHAILRRALQQGVRWGWLATNPASLASAPRVRSAEVEPPDPEGVLRLIEAAADADPDLGCYLHMAAATGARRGELCGLQWRDVDLDAELVTISRNVVEAKHGVLVVKDTKNHTTRRVPIGHTTARMLRGHQNRCTERALACGSSLLPVAYVFSLDPVGERPLVPNDVTKRFIRIRNKVGLENVRLHDLRHFSVTQLLAAGVPMRAVSDRHGHDPATMYKNYAHAVEKSARVAASTMDAVLTRKAPRSPKPAGTRGRKSAGTSRRSA
jgi:integrase